MENILRPKEYWTIVEIEISEMKIGATLTQAQERRLDEQKLKDLKVKN